MSEVRRHIPNLVSSTRLVMAAVFPLASPIGQIWLCVLAALSDILDGAVARRLGTESPLGNIVDPVADKVFVLTVFATFLFQGAIQPWEVGVLLARDVAVVGSAVVLLAMGRPGAIRESHSRILGKATTVLQFTVFAVLIVWQQTFLWLIVAAAVVSFAAGVDYLYSYYRNARRRQPA